MIWGILRWNSTFDANKQGLFILIFIVNVDLCRIQVYDDDGKAGPDGKDQLIGSGFFSLKELEAGSIVSTSLPLTDGKRSKSPGFLVVRSYKEHQGGGISGTLFC